MALNHSPSIVTNGLVFAYDMNNTQKSWKGAPITNAQWNNGVEVNPWTVGGENTDVTGTSYQGPVANSKTWRFKKTGSSNQWNGWEASYGAIWTGSSGDVWTTSYWYKTSAPAGLTGFGIGAFFTPDWVRAYNTTVLANVSSIIADGEWHYNYTTVQFNESYTNAIIVDGPSWGYSTQSGELFINGLQWNKNNYATAFAAGTRSNTQAIVDLTNTNTVTATSLTYNSNNTFSFNGTSNSISIGNVLPINTAGQQITIDVWIFATRASGYIIGRGQNNANYGHYSLALNGLTPQFGIYSSVAAIPAQYFLSGINIILNTWNHICISHIAGNSASTKFTINDVSTGSWTTGDGTAVSDQTSTSLEVGHWYGTPTATSNAYWFQGDISLVKLYNRVLSTTEIKQNFNALRGRYGL